MNQACWLGVFPGIEAPHMEYVLKTLGEFLKQY